MRRREAAGRQTSSTQKAGIRLRNATMAGVEFHDKMVSMKLREIHSIPATMQAVEKFAEICFTDIGITPRNASGSIALVTRQPHQANI